MTDTRRDRFRVQVLVTQRCNAVCENCDKAVGLARMPDMEMTSEDMGRYVDQMLAERFPVTHVSVSGGEPVVNRELQGILWEIARLRARKVRVYSNGLTSTQERRDSITLPDERFAWKVSPLDDVDDPTSGKNVIPDDRSRRHVHLPCWTSPADVGVESSFWSCTVKCFCGKGLDKNDWTMCGQAPILGRVLGIDPYTQADTIREKVLTPIQEICRHCPWGIVAGKKAKQQFFRKHNGMSKTYRRAFRLVDGKLPILELPVLEHK